MGSHQQGWAARSGQPATREPSLASRLGPSGECQAHFERCEYCQCNRHFCGCNDRFDYEQIRDNPTLFAR